MGIRGQPSPEGRGLGPWTWGEGARSFSSSLPKMRGTGKERGPPEGCGLEYLRWLDREQGGPLLRDARETYG